MNSTHKILEPSHTRSAILFYKNECMYCKNFRKAWENITNNVLANKNISTYNVNVNKKGTSEIIKILKSRGIVVDYVPTLVLVKSASPQNIITKYPHNLRSENEAEIIKYITTF
jgi:thioredoxin-related protein